MRIGNDIYVVALEGIAATRPLDAIPDAVKRNAVRAVNYAATRARTRSADEIREQVAFPASYLRGQDSRLTLRTAKGFGDEAVITGRFRPTSLARFATRGTPGKPGLTLQVQPGKTVTFARRDGKNPRMFLIRLRAGSADLDTQSNLGVAIRLKEGETIQNKRFTVQRMKNGLALIYGPAVSQVFRSVAGDQMPLIEDDLQREFERLMEAGV